MKTVIIYYTLGGATKKEAERLAQELNAPVHQVREVRSRSVWSAFVPGCIQAINRQAVSIRPLDVHLDEYDRIVIGCPVWAGHPAPAFNAMAELLPGGKEVEVFLCSGGGETAKSEQGTRALIERKGCTLISYRNVMTNVPPRKMKE